MNASSLPALRLKRNEERRIRAGHLWVFSNEIDIAKTPITAFEPGDQAQILAHDGRELGVAYVNPRSLITARIIGRTMDTVIDESLLSHRINVALSLRKRINHDSSGRLIYGESDRLPGLIIDRLDNVLVGQITTAGMERWRSVIADLLREKLDVDTLIWRNDGPMRKLEGLESYVETEFGEMPQRLTLTERGIPFSVDAKASQKTGWFFDQRANRDRLAPYVRDQQVLDVFSYAGGWGVRAAMDGARHVTFVDSGEQAVADVEHNVAANGVGDRCRIIRDDAFRFLEAALKEEQRYGVIILDPPAFAKRRKDVKPALKAYRRINELALRLLDRDGILITCSCSQHVHDDRFLDTVLQAGRHVDRHLQLLELLQQSPDHPVHPAIPETRYLKGAIYRSTVG